MGMLHGGIPAPAVTSPMCPKKSLLTDFGDLLPVNE
jgi:hypothetical protein